MQGNLYLGHPNKLDLASMSLDYYHHTRSKRREEKLKLTQPQQSFVFPVDNGDIRNG